VIRNFAMPNPEGYRKALRVMQMAEQFGMPIFTFVDTPGAFPGIGAEERGQAEAIARNLREMAALKVPVIVTVTGEGGSGGALAIAVGNRVLMMEYSVYSVISPEGCAAILWNDGSKGPVAAEALKLTARDIMAAGLYHRRCHSRAFRWSPQGSEGGCRTGPALPAQTSGRFAGAFAGRVAGTALPKTARHDHRSGITPGILHAGP
jgi:hypothetical protein